VVDWWIALHLLLAVSFALLAVALFVGIVHESGPAARLARMTLCVFVVGNSVFIGVDGIATGLIVRGARPLPAAQQIGAEQALEALWNSPLNAAMGGWWAGLAWALAVGASALALYPQARQRVPLVLLLLSLAVNIGIRAGLSPDILLPPAGGGLLGVVQVLLGLAIIGVVAARGGAATAPFALLIIAAILPQHGGAVGAVGVACLGLALVWREHAVHMITSRVGPTSGIKSSQTPPSLRSWLFARGHSLVAIRSWLFARGY
jgi:hypothetical protein